MGSPPPTRRTTLVTECLNRTARLGKPGRILSPRVDFVRTVGPLAGRLWRDEVEGEAWSLEVRRHLYWRLWSEATAALGATLEPYHEDFWLIRTPETHTIVHNHHVMIDNAIREQMSLDKALVQRLLGEAGIPVPAYVEVDADDPVAGLEFMAAKRGPCVVKPASGTSGGDGVTLGVETAEQFHRARIWARRWNWRLLVEEQACGDEYRFLFLDGRCLDVTRRRPPRLVGDGHSTVLELLTAENARRRASDGATAVGPITVKLDTLFALQRAGLHFRSVPAEGSTFAVSGRSNEGAAEDSESVPLTEVCEALLAQVRAAVEAVELRLAGVDVVTADLSRTLGDARGVVLEVNTTPGVHYHYLVSDPSRAARVAIPLLAAVLGVDEPAGWRPHELLDASQ